MNRSQHPAKISAGAAGSDLRFRIAFSAGYSHAMTLNNDTHISKGFVAARAYPLMLDRRADD
jgi:hypothetical protein